MTLLRLDEYALIVPATVLGLLGKWLARALALRLNIVNQPNPIVPQHTRPVSYLGGLGIGIGIVATSVLAWLMAQMGWAPWGWAGAWPVAIAVGAAAYLALGIYDDLKVLSPRAKFTLQALVAAVAVCLGLYAPITGVGWLDAALTWFWILLLVNAFNLTDVCDGLVGGLTCLTMFFLAHLAGEWQPHALVTAGASLGFLAFNRPPATIFLGDGGSHPLGFLAAVLTLQLFSQTPDRPLLAASQGALLVAVPLFELFFVSSVRVHKGLPWWRGSPDHFALRLQAAGLSRWQTILIAWLAAAALGGAALGVQVATGTGWAAIAAAVTVGILIAAVGLLRCDPPARRA